MDSNTLFSILSILLAIFSISLAIYLHKKDLKDRDEKERKKTNEEENNKAKIVASKEIAFDKNKKLYTIKLRNESQMVSIYDLQVKMRIINESTNKSYPLNPINFVGRLHPANISKPEENELLISVKPMTINQQSIDTYGEDQVLNLYQQGKLTLEDVLTDNSCLQIFATGIDDKQMINKCVLLKSYRNCNIKPGHFNKGEMEVKEENIPFNT